MTAYKPVSVDEMMIEHVVRTAYMGFMLSKNANDHIRQQIAVDVDWLLKLLENYNNETKNEFYKVRIKVKSPEEIYLVVLGTHRFFHSSMIEIVLGRLNKLLAENLEATVTQNAHPIVFDINTLQPLQRTGVTTMGCRYHASDKKRYMLHFFHLYSIAHG